MFEVFTNKYIISKLFLSTINIDYPINKFYFVILETSLILFIISMINFIKIKIGYMGYEKLIKTTTIDGINIYHRKYDYGSTYTYFPFSYITIDHDIKFYKYRLNHELTHVKYYHDTISLIITVILNSYFDNLLIRFLIYIFGYVYMYFCEIYADYNSFKYIDDKEVFDVIDFHMEKYFTMLDNFKNVSNISSRILLNLPIYLDYHPNDKFRSYYIKKLIIYRKLGIKYNFFTFLIDQFYPFIISDEGYKKSLQQISY